MNNNRGNNNNRRRGRGNNNRQNGGGQQLNRVDSRARGNAPQLLEKYRKLAHDAHLNGDRVTEEYNLQFAEHYFRVIADARQRQEEQRARRDERFDGEGGGERFEEEQSEYAESEYQPYDQAHYQRPQREDRAQQRDDRPREDRPRREDRAERQDRNAGRGDDRPREVAAEAAAEPAATQADVEPVFEPAENPFLRESRGNRGLKPRREASTRRPRREERPAEAEDSEPAGLDPLSLPPAISRAAPEPEQAAEPVEAPKPRKPRARKPKPAADEALEKAS